MRADRVWRAGGPDLGRLTLTCTTLAVEAARIDCADGGLTLEGGAAGRIAGALGFDYDFAAGRVRLRPAALALAGARVRGELARTPAGFAGDLRVSGLDLAALDRLAVAGLGIEHGYGDLAGRIDLAVAGAWPGRLRVRAAFRGITFNGPSAAEDLAGTLDFALEEAAGTLAFDGSATLAAGVAYVEPGFTLNGQRPGFTIDLPGGPLALDLHGRRVRERLDLAQVRLRHPGVVDVEIVARGETGPSARLEHARVTVREGAAGPLYATWLKPLLLGTKYDDLELEGGVTGHAEVRDGAPVEVELSIANLTVWDGRGRFHVDGLEGTLALTERPAPVTSALAWQAAGLYRIGLGAARIAFTSSAGGLRTTGPARVPFLDGALAIDALTLARTAGDPHPTLTLDGRLEPVSMQVLTQALGWPHMQGQVAGGLTGLTYRRGRLRVLGDITIDAFDGRVTVRKLRVSDLFERAPRLYADIALEGIDLEQLTGTFSFGMVTGRLEGLVDDLELQAWQPVAFDARFATPADDGSRHRISRRAVDNLGTLGGGTSGVMSQGMLAFFDEYSYDRLGVGCRLYNGYCELSGVEDGPDGFYLLTRGGLLPPWIDVKGTGRSIAWRDLVGGLKTIARGEVVIE